jgi:hypothetical protein
MLDLSFWMFHQLAFATLVLNLYSHSHIKRPTSIEVHESP